jgi:hypothetical protein
MTNQDDTHAKTFGYAVIAAGLVLSFVSAVVPHYTHHKLLFGVLLVGLLPYLIYGVIVVFLNRTLTIAAGIVVLVIHAGIVIGKRFSDVVDYSDGLIYTVPIIVSLMLLPLAVMALGKPWHK